MYTSESFDLRLVASDDGGEIASMDAACFDDEERIPGRGSILNSHERSLVPFFRLACTGALPFPPAKCTSPMRRCLGLGCSAVCSSRVTLPELLMRLNEGESQGEDNEITVRTGGLFKTSF